MVGIPPFYHQNQNIMFQLIKEGEVKFPSKIEMSEEAKDFIKNVGTISVFFNHFWKIVNDERS